MVKAQTAGDDAPDTLLFIVQEKLSDGSVAFNVLLGEHKWSAITHDDAVLLAEAIVDAIDHLTTNTADVVDETAW